MKIPPYEIKLTRSGGSSDSFCGTVAFDKIEELHRAHQQIRSHSTWNSHVATGEFLRPCVAPASALNGIAS
jgi:hypothetical protein